MSYDQILANIISGISYGTIYGLLGMSVVLLYRTNHFLNFAQTDIATLMVICMFFLLKKMSYFEALGLTLVLSFILGAGLHVSVMRVITERKRVEKTNVVVITIGMLMISNALSLYVFGDDPEIFPAPWPQGSISFFGANVLYAQLAIAVASLLTILAIALFFRFTRLGLVLEAIAENNEAARLRGVRTSNYLAMSWGITFLLNAFCAILLAPTLFLSPAMLTTVFSYALMAVAIGGLESPFGAFIGGIIIGVAENLASNWAVIGSSLKFVVVTLIMLMILIIFPRGFGGRREQRRA